MPLRVLSERQGMTTSMMEQKLPSTSRHASPSPPCRSAAPAACCRKWRGAGGGGRGLPTISAAAAAAAAAATAGRPGDCGSLGTVPLRLVLLAAGAAARPGGACGEPPAAAAAWPRWLCMKEAVRQRAQPAVQAAACCWRLSARPTSPSRYRMRAG